jgi:photosystem II stability/assembly factor-like uncharacterized protein
VDDLSFRSEFHRALDAVSPPAPWLAASVREELRRRRPVASPSRRQVWLSPVLPRVSMRLATAALIVALAVAAAGAFIAINNYIRGPIPTRPHGGAITRICNQQGSATFTITGWPESPTSTGWQNSPPNVPGWVKGGESTCVLDSNHAWVTEATGISSCPGTPPCAGPQVQHVVVVSTKDGGHTWLRSQPIPASGANLAVEVDFLDDHYGWLLTDTGYYATPQFVRTLFATTDGGLHWSRVSSASASAGSGLAHMAVGCAENGIVFVNADKGWLTWTCSSSNGPAPTHTAGPVVATTVDGGRTWAPVILPSYPAGTDWSCGSTPPIFTGNHGVLQLSCGGIGHPGWDAVYMSADYGATWTVGQFPVPFYGPVDFVDSNTGFFVTTNVTDNAAGSDLYRTVDGGRTWTLAKKGLFPGQNIDDFEFIDANTGFANTSGEPATWKTTDGGKSWSLPPGASPATSPNPPQGFPSALCAVGRDTTGAVVTRPAWVPIYGPASAKMMTATTGWATGDLRTTDGGARWRDVSPASLRADLPSNGGKAALYPPAYSEFFLDSNNAWIARSYSTSTACVDHISTFSTSDGGLTWQESAPVASPFPGLKQGSYLQLGLDFIDSQHGWLFVGATITVPQVGSVPLHSESQSMTYTTTNGGRDWQVVSNADGPCLPVTFESTNTGWSCGSDGSSGNQDNQISVTRDGGVTWQVQRLPKPPGGCGCATHLPVFFNQTEGVVQVDGNSWKSLLRTSDGGKTWRLLPPLPGNRWPVAISFSDANNFWLLATPPSWFKGAGTPTDWLYHSTTGGKSWTLVQRNTPAGWGLGGANVTLQFVDDKHGFVVQSNQETGSGPLQVLATADGGHTWKRVGTLPNVQAPYVPSI